MFGGELQFGTEYRVEWLGPSYMKRERPLIIGDVPKLLGFGQPLQLKVRLPASSHHDANIRGASPVVELAIVPDEYLQSPSWISAT